MRHGSFTLHGAHVCVKVLDQRRHNNWIGQCNNNSICMASSVKSVKATSTFKVPRHLMKNDTSPIRRLMDDGVSAQIPPQNPTADAPGQLAIV